MYEISVWTRSNSNSYLKGRRKHVSVTDINLQAMWKKYAYSRTVIPRNCVYLDTDTVLQETMRFFNPSKTIGPEHNTL